MRFPRPLLAVFVASCTTVPKFRYDGTEGTVLADSPSVAANVAAALDELVPIVRSYLGSPEDTPVTVYVVKRDSPGSCIYDDLGRTQPAHIELNRELDTEKRRRFALYHELVHWFGQDTWVGNLPLYLEEGVADYLACTSIDAVELRHVEKPLPPGTTLNLTQLHSITPREWQKASPEQVDFMYRAGFAVVYRIGIPRLRDAASGGSLTPTDIRQLFAESVAVGTPRD